VLKSKKPQLSRKKRGNYLRMISSTAKKLKNVEEAYLWINYVLDPKVASDIAKEGGFSVTNQSAEQQ